MEEPTARDKRTLLIIALIALAIPLTTFGIKTIQDLRSRAALPPSDSPEVTIKTWSPEAGEKILTDGAVVKGKLFLEGYFTFITNNSGYIITKTAGGPPLFDLGSASITKQCGYGGIYAVKGCNIIWDTTKHFNGTYSLMLQAQKTKNPLEAQPRDVIRLNVQNEKPPTVLPHYGAWSGLSTLTTPTQLQTVSGPNVSIASDIRNQYTPNGGIFIDNETTPIKSCSFPKGQTQAGNCNTTWNSTKVSNGFHYISLQFTNELGGTFTDFVRVNVNNEGVGKPDLVIIDFIRALPDGATAGDKVELHGVGQNQGDDYTPSIAIDLPYRFRLDIDNNGSWDRTWDTSTNLTTIGADFEERKFVTWDVATAGTHKFEICIDTRSTGNGIVPESNENNNCKVDTFTISGGGGGKPDLVIDSTRITPNNPTAGGLVGLYGVGKNVGSEYTPPSTINLPYRFRLDIDNNGSWDRDWETASSVTTIPTNFEDSESVAWEAATAGTHKFEVCVDTNTSGSGVVSESNEGNNCKTHNFTVGGTGGGDTTKPTVTITKPVNGTTVSGTINVEASATDNVGVIKVEFYIDGGLKSNDTSSPYTYSWNTTTVSNANHALSAKAYDAAGNVGVSSSVNVNVNNGGTDTTKPTVTITKPVNGTTVSGIVDIEVTATDNVAISSITIDIEEVKKTCSVSPCTYSWDTRTAANGPWLIIAQATDSSSNGGSDEITVNVNNEGGPTDTWVNTISLSMNLPTALIGKLAGTVSIPGTSFSQEISVGGGTVTLNLSLSDGVMKVGIAGKIKIQIAKALRRVVVQTPSGKQITVNADKIKLGDLNSDGAINSIDYSILVSSYIPKNDAKADLNLDTVVNSIDYSMMLANYSEEADPE